jgi:hypothetical protein
MSAFGDEDFDIDMAIEQSLLDEDMHLLPPSQSVGQLAPQEEMQSWIDAVENVAAVEDPVVPSVPPFGSGLTIGIIVLALSYFHIERLQWHADWARSVFRARPGLGDPTCMQCMPFPRLCPTKCLVSVQANTLLMSFVVLHAVTHAHA